MLVTLLSLASLACASSVSVQYPLQDQLPLIARVNEAYTWSFSRDTFVSSSNASLVYSSSTLPAWLSFDNATLTLQGTPSSTDAGTPGIRITATDPSNDDSANSSFDLCVTPYPAPQLHIPVEQQFYATNPSLSSVFLISDKSALNSTGKPALRIPPSWSFSIGFLYDTFTGAGGDLYYDALRSDGSPLPDWVEFNPKVLTFNGVTPKMTDSAEPTSVSLALHASDQEGYSAGSVAFDIVIAAHEVSMSMSSLPTINITANTPFNFSLTSPDDFFGVLLDGKPIQPEDISSLGIDTTAYKAWLHYDSATRTLSGQAPDDSDGDNNLENPTVPVTITANVNQSISANVSLAVVHSFFTTATLQPILVLPDHSLEYNLAQFFSNSTELGAPNQGDVNISAAFDPTSAAGYLSFDSSHWSLTGNIPADAAQSYSHISVTFTAYSHITHSTSHTTLPISLSNADYEHQKTGGLSEAAKQKLLLGLKIGFSVLSCIIGIAFALAGFRRCARVRDTALTGTEGTKAYTAEEMRWYGIGIEVDGKVTEGPKHDVEAQLVDSEKDGYSSPSPAGPSGFGIALRRVLSHPRSLLSSLPSPRLPQSPGVMRKGEFMGKVRSTARIVSDKYKRSLGKRPRRLVIGKPTLVATTDHRVSARMGVPVNIDGLPFTMPPNAEILPATLEPVASHPAPIPFEDMNLSHYAPSGMSSIAGSPSSSTGGRSIPRRRADFAPPKRKAAKVNYSAPGENGKRSSVDSAVVQTAARATSVRSGYSADGPKTPDMSRPRLVPFTSASRVPVPKLPTNIDQDSPVLGAVAGGAKTKRVASQVAKIFRGAAGAEKRAAAHQPSADDLNTSLNYVRALGDDTQSAASGSIGTGKIPIVPRMLARTGEQFKFRVPVSYSAGPLLTSAPGSSRKQKVLEARLMNGKPLPRYVKTDLTAIVGGAGARVEKRVVEFWGVPTSRDTGELNVGIYEKESDKCVGRVIIQIVERSS
ncbi:uncharacterized protein C8Q71DRAFT_717611 [Rhodofomes roseus]|uniref:Dystroglycan-type cadherin-like domain-containing protein n=1 Tax=Rhodofomes roseus TaxID=34475 RepID=A0ABQ8K0K3_9APHY|nr:uncharacterized protein C8Q71DRAFT_717611 [Rhodofomes roseus]KAH9829945.1 hypothetical protein C8Q71DRAFT_717611 [Rhodofomes roseus]